ncbi:MAG: aminopeptidase P family protein [Alloprevotella sp.]|nr:aminopeptidase P family protein [Alloprevotella sp.]
MRKKSGVGALLIFNTDPHGSEYIADHWKCIQWLSGFTGEAATMIVTADRALLWTDSRFWLQAEEQLADTGIELMREGREDTPNPAEWLHDKIAGYANVGVLSECVSVGELDYIMQSSGCTFLKESIDCFSAIWTDRPALPSRPLTIMREDVTGQSVAQRITSIWDRIKTSKPDFYLLTDLSEIAWTLNLRGADIDYNPVFYSYLLLKSDLSATLFTAEGHLTPEVRAHLATHNVSVRPYEDWKQVFKEVAGHTVTMDAKANALARQLALEENVFCGFSTSPVPALRAIKTPTEIEGFRRAMEYDGVAMVRFLRWLDEHLCERPTEIEVDNVLTAFRAENPCFRGLSFATIAAYGPHGAIVHYEATPATAVPLEPRGLLLLDSGGQYDFATTDITRTIALGPLTDEEREAYTLVLKGHIDLQMALFPTGTPGIALDAIARRPLWLCGYDFGHGTGHGVGSYLCVHEGPAQIRKNVNEASTTGYRPGMVVTDEPGIYAAGKFGVRIENTILCVERNKTPFGNFCGFEPLTLCPYDLKPVVWERLDETEKNWLNAYHAEVRKRLWPYLTDAADKAWLDTHTQPVK